MSLPGSRVPLFKITYANKGRIKDIKENIVHVDGLHSCLNGQLVDFGNDVKGIVMGYDERHVLIMVLGDSSRLRMGQEITGKSEPFEIPVGDGFIGRMVSTLGVPCDQRPEIEPDKYLPVFRQSPPITHRRAVDEFLPSGTRLVDIFVPLAKGQRQLILGDRITGKTVIATDAILSQKGRNVLCIYCAIGKSVSSLEKVLAMLQTRRALDYTILMIAPDNAPVGEQYLVPFAAASMADYFVNKGRDVLVIFDDLTKHAWAYRQLSLLLDRPPGREAYPGDIFYVQTQLMERAGSFNGKFGGGSSTYLGIAETLQGDLTGYIPSNLASMCDGQICLNSTLFAEGFRPAIDLTFSLSIIGGRVQPRLLKDLSFGLRADFARYEEVVRLSRLQSTMSGDAERIAQRGRAIRAITQQAQNRPSPLSEQILLLYALKKGMLHRLSDSGQARMRNELYGFVRDEHPDLIEELDRSDTQIELVENKLNRALAAFFDQVSFKGEEEKTPKNDGVKVAEGDEPE